MDCVKDMTKSPTKNSVLISITIQKRGCILVNVQLVIQDGIVTVGTSFIVDLIWY